MNFKDRYKYDPHTDLIGNGGFSRVFKAWDSILRRYVALKIFSAEASEKYDLINEISRVISLEHPNLCRYFDIAILDSTNALGEKVDIQVGIMDFLDGGDIRTFNKNNPGHLNKLLVDVLAGLSHLHRNGIVHRDIKPKNILVKNTSEGPVAKITDFGISKVISSDQKTRSSVLMGTIDYMAPEQFNPAKYGKNGKLSTNVDLWGFGCLVYEIVMNEKIFGSSDNTSSEQVMNAILNDNYQAKIQYLHEPYKTVIEKCLVKNAEQRAGEARDLIYLLLNKPARV